jgi:hypothetical protein
LQCYPGNPKYDITEVISPVGEKEYQPQLDAIEYTHNRTTAQTSPQYSPTNLNEYNGPDIDWNSHHLQSMSARLAKIMLYSNKAFNDLFEKLDKIYEKISLEKKE